MALGASFKINRKLYPRLFSQAAPYFIVNEFPKSGGTWLSNLLSTALDLPFPQHKPLKFEKCIVHGHFLNPFGLKNVILLWRDPRDIIVSYYYHCYFLNEHHNAELVSRMKKICPFDNYHDTKENLPQFIRALTHKPISPSYTWSKFVDVWSTRRNVINTRYEVLRARTDVELSRIIKMVTGHTIPHQKALEATQDNSFANSKKKAKKNSGQIPEVSFVREGSVGGWQKHFSDAARAEMSDYVPGMLKLGYIKDGQTW